MRKYGRTDSNHTEIVNALRRCGYSVVSLASVGGGVPDLLVGVRGKNLLIEIKADKKKVLTMDQVRFFDTWRGNAERVNNIDEAIKYIQEQT